MKNLFLATALLASIPLMAEETQPIPAYVLPNAVHTLLTDIIHTSSSLISVGERGHILSSTDGKAWVQGQVPIQSNLNSVYFVDANQGWAVGHDASILHTTDGGRTWSIQQFLPSLDKPLFDIVFFDELHGIAIGAYGLFYRTHDAGAHWQLEYHVGLANVEDQSFLNEIKQTDPDAYEAELASVLPHLNRLVLVGSRLHLVGEGGLYAISDDQGLTWQRQTSFYNGSLFGIAAKQDTLMVVGLRGHVFRSSDAGQHWNQIDIPSPATLNSVIATEQGFVIVGNSGTVLWSTDKGQSFQALPQVDGKAVLNAAVYQGQLQLATELGIRKFDLSAVAK